MDAMLKMLETAEQAARDALVLADRHPDVQGMRAAALMLLERAQWWREVYQTMYPPLHSGYMEP